MSAHLARKNTKKPLNGHHIQLLIYKKFTKQAALKDKAACS